MIQTVNLTRYYASLAAVQDLSLTVEQGELFGFLGPNGAGKTTTIRMIVGLLRPTEGTVKVAGHDVQQEPLAADQLIESYSGGMRHKIGLCGALLHEPPVLVLDEPLAGLDPYSARRVKDLLRDLCQQGSTVFLSTHVLEVAERVCDRVGILDQGRLVAVGTIEALRAHARTTAETTLEDLFLQLTAGERAAEMVSLLG
ncbi:MAG: ATP-binding cassette domain-containing protein [Anaerolineae bacterium]